MTQEELKVFILSRITLNKEFWEPRIEAFFKENTVVTREKTDAFFKEWLGIVRKDSSVFLEEYLKTRNIASEVFLSDVETRIFDNARRKKGLIPLEEVALAKEEVDTAFDELGFNE